MSEAWSRPWRIALLLYLVALHAVVLILVVKTNFLPLAGKTLGWLPPEEWSEPLDRAIIEQSAHDRDTPSGALIIVGDSIMEGLKPGLIAPDAVNFGLGGITTRMLMVRWPLLRSIDAARLIVIGVGVNDLKYRTPSEIAADYAKLLALTPRVPKIAVSVLPVDEQTDAMRRRPYLKNEAIRDLNTRIKLACEARPDCRYLDAWPEMLDSGTHQLRGPYHGGDGWHLSDAGGRALAAEIRLGIR
jgi:lysophospholipase L1-like esterase